MLDFGIVSLILFNGRVSEVTPVGYAIERKAKIEIHLLWGLLLLFASCFFPGCLWCCGGLAGWQVLGNRTGGQGRWTTLLLWLFGWRMWWHWKQERLTILFTRNYSSILIDVKYRGVPFVTIVKLWSCSRLLSHSDGLVVFQVKLFKVNCTLYIQNMTSC